MQQLPRPSLAKADRALKTRTRILGCQAGLCRYGAIAVNQLQPGLLRNAQDMGGLYLPARVMLKHLQKLTGAPASNPSPAYSKNYGIPQVLPGYSGGTRHVGFAEHDRDSLLAKPVSDAARVHDPPASQ